MDAQHHLDDEGDVSGWSARVSEQGCTTHSDLRGGGGGPDPRGVPPATQQLPGSPSLDQLGLQTLLKVPEEETAGLGSLCAGHGCCLWHGPPSPAPLPEGGLFQRLPQTPAHGRGKVCRMVGPAMSPKCLLQASAHSQSCRLRLESTPLLPFPHGCLSSLQDGALIS